MSPTKLVVTLSWILSLSMPVPVILTSSTKSAFLTSFLLYFSKNTFSEIFNRFKVSVNGQKMLDDLWGLKIYLNINIFMQTIPYVSYPTEIRRISLNT